MINRLFLLIPFLFLALISCNKDEVNVNGCVYLSFDDGPDSVNTPLVLDVLSNCNVKATFFCLGSCIEKKQWVVNRIVSEGHVLANHTYDHCYLPKLDDTTIIANINKTELLIQEFQGWSFKLIRPPWGAIYDYQTEYLKSFGFRVVLWDIDSFDHDLNYTVNDIVDNVMSKIKPNTDNIILFHDSDYTLLESRMNTVNALPIIIEQLKNLNYSFKTIAN